ncbi:conserved hypothetical protein [Neorickettsia risticii str. Illinois]|uniref:Uncharacterized protein n=1 Tax=Neorickettsia risticii (strain Illinois) TaxID=434131 RepID=C6V3X5_NEORI|nr:conserved hypothetical protein [Neorickettsia risticii str. Illinois]
MFLHVSITDNLYFVRGKEVIRLHSPENLGVDFTVSTLI